jgi:hypothetical protein
MQVYPDNKVAPHEKNEGYFELGRSDVTQRIIMEYV